MKLLASEHKDLIKAIKQSGQNHEDFMFIKKGGVVRITHPTSSTPFTFYRKTETKLIDQQFEKVTTYYRDLPQKAPEAYDWNGILKEFKSWIKEK